MFRLIFRSTNQINSWGDIELELDPVKHLLVWPLQATSIDIQPYFGSWYEWAWSHHETRCLVHHSNVVGSDVNKDNHLLSTCNCYEQSPYRQHEKWSLQNAMIYAAHVFLDKTQRINNWSAGSSPQTSTLSTNRRAKMINYAAYDCLATTFLIRPILEKWSFQRVKNINLIESFQTFKSTTPPPLRQPKKKIKSLNVQKLVKILGCMDSDIEPISDDDDDDEVYLNQLIGPVHNHHELGSAELYRLEPEIIVDDLGEQPEPIVDEVVEQDEPVVNDVGEQPELVVDDLIESPEEASAEPIQQPRRSARQKRSAEARNRHNRKHTQQRRRHRYRYAMKRQVDHRFKLYMIRRILRMYHVPFLDIKIDGDYVVIGLKNEETRREMEHDLAFNMFNRRSYYHYKRRYQW